MEPIVFTGYEAKPVMAQKLAVLVKQVEDLQAEVEKLKQAAEPAKKTVKAKPAEE